MSGSWAPTDLAVGMHAPPHMVTVAIPAGVGPGQSFQLQTADGGSFQVTVPPGLGPGQSLTVQMPAAPPAGLLPPQASAPAAFAHVAPGGQRESFQPADNARIEAARRSGTLSCRLEDVVLSTGMVLRFEVQFGPPGAPLGKLRSSPTGMAQVNLANGNTRVVEELQVAPGPGPPQPAAAAAAFAHVAPDGTRTPYSDVDNAAIVAAKACGEAKVRVADVALPTGQMLRFEVNFGSSARGSPSGMVQINMDNGNRRNVEKIPSGPGPPAPGPGPGLPTPHFQHVAPDGARTAYSAADNAKIHLAKVRGDSAVRVDDVRLPTGQVLQFEVRFGDRASRGSWVSSSRMAQVNLASGNIREVEIMPAAAPWAPRDLDTLPAAAMPAPMPTQVRHAQ